MCSNSKPSPCGPIPQNLAQTSDGPPTQAPEEKVQAFVNDMPHEILEMASEYAIRQSRSGRGTSHTQAIEKIKEQRGWK